MSIIKQKAKALVFKTKKWYRKYFTIYDAEHTLLPDKIYLRRLYKEKNGEQLNLNSPKTFTEKLNWLKLYDKRPEYTIMADKYAVRKYINSILGERFLVPLLGVWDNPEEIDFSLLPNRFVLKANHDSNIFVCVDKERQRFEDKSGRIIIGFAEVVQELKRRLQIDYYKFFREWPYKNIPRKVICERFMENTNGDSLLDYKLFCFNGIPKLIMINSNRFQEGGVKTDIYDTNWNHLDMQDEGYPMLGDVFAKPPEINELLQISTQLAEGIPFVRIDYNVWDRVIYFGEFTFYHNAGMERFQPEEWDRKLGEWLDLPRKRVFR